MHRGRGGHYRGTGMFGSQYRRDSWYGPKSDGNRSSEYDGYRAHGYDGDHSSHYGTRRRGGGGNNKSGNIIICKHYALFDQCRFGNKCSFVHSLKRVISLTDVFRGGVFCSTVCRLNEQCLELFACGYGPTIKRWKLSGDQNGEIHLSEQPIIDISVHNELRGAVGSTRGRRSHNSEQYIHSLHCIDECLFIGLRSGHICVFHLPSGNSTILNGHSAPVNCIIVINFIVLSVCENGKINLWSFDSATGLFNCVNSLLMKTKVNCLLEVMAETENPGVNLQTVPPSTTRSLWAGGSVINIIELTTLSIAKTITLPDNAHAKSLVRYGKHVIAGLSNGSIMVYSCLGDEVYESKGDRIPLTALDGMETAEGDLLLFGNKSGFITAVQLPSFEPLGTLACHAEGYRNSQKGGISSIAPLGPSHFLTTGYDGNISVFAWNDT